jgi:hypothetical protein
MSLDAFRTWYGNRRVPFGDGSVQLGKYWLEHEDRRQYEGITFAPGRDVPRHYNLWRGFTVEAKAGDCTKFKDHLLNNVCRGDEEGFQYFFAWWAHIFQKPGEKIGTSLVVRGKMGTGKTILGKIFGHLLGVHYRKIADPRYITGRFNGHLASLLVLHVDEGFWAGDRSAEGKLKDLVTGEDHPIEFKGKEPIWVPNLVRPFFTGNPDWMVPAGMEERRFAMYEMGEAHMQDTGYFAAIIDQMEKVGYAALLYDLLHFDLSKVNLRQIPKTAALLEQKVLSMTPEAAWWLDTLMRGELPWGCEEGTNRCPREHLFDRYVSHAGKVGVRRRSIETTLGMFLSKHVPGLKGKKDSYEVWDARKETMGTAYGRVYQFPPLKQCREAFAAALGQEVQWEEPEAGWACERAAEGHDDIAM